MGLHIGGKAYYNLVKMEAARTLNSYEEAQYILRELENRDVHVAVLEKYVVNSADEKTDRVIDCIAWWSSEQIRMARRFVSGVVAQTDATFNTNAKAPSSVLRRDR